MKEIEYKVLGVDDLELLKQVNLEHEKNKRFKNVF